MEVFTVTYSPTLPERMLMALCLLVASAMSIAVAGALALYSLAAMTHPDDSLNHALAWGRLIWQSFV
jgi:hypothetical protein